MRPAPLNPRLTSTDKSGELLLKFDRVNNAANYSVQTAPAATGPWADEDISTATRVLIGGLTPGERAVGARLREWSTPATAKAL